MSRTRAQSMAARHDLEAERLAVIANLAALAPAWLGTDGPGRVDVTGHRRRSQSSVLTATVGAGGAEARVMVKVQHPVVGDAGRVGRLVAPELDGERRCRFEADTLLTVAAGIQAAGDRRFGWVDVWDRLPDPPALVVRVIDQPSLRDRLRQAPPAGTVLAGERALANLGAWLALFHRLRTPHAVPRCEAGDDATFGVPALIDDLRRQGRGEATLERAERLVARWRPDPLTLPVGLGHGDLAPRNVLVGPDDQVTVYDSLGRFLVPVHEDAAYLLVELAAGSTRLTPHGRPRAPRSVARLRSSFLAAYPLPEDPVLWFFELRAALDKWCALAGRGGPRSVLAAREWLVARQATAAIARLEEAL